MHDYDTETAARRRRLDEVRQRPGPDVTTRATQARADEWASDRIVDPGDTHDKGEASLCVGEAA
jgi:hypothetical protein